VEQVEEDQNIGAGWVAKASDSISPS
jgi:hypothetical protein